MEKQMDRHGENRPLGALVSELAQETTTLVRQEVALAKAETRARARRVKAGVRSQIIGAGLLLIALVYILDAVVYGLARLMPYDYLLWLAALIVGVGAFVASLFLLKTGGLKVLTSNLSPSRTTASVKRDLATIRDKL